MHNPDHNRHAIPRMIVYTTAYNIGDTCDAAREMSVFTPKNQGFPGDCVDTFWHAICLFDSINP
jgi:hypothetical protein